jgi:hypothetical protein
LKAKTCIALLVGFLTNCWRNLVSESFADNLVSQQTRVMSCGKIQMKAESFVGHPFGQKIFSWVGHVKNDTCLNRVCLEVPPVLFLPKVPINIYECCTLMLCLGLYFPSSIHITFFFAMYRRSCRVFGQGRCLCNSQLHSQLPRIR